MPLPGPTFRILAGAAPSVRVTPRGKPPCYRYVCPVSRGSFLNLFCFGKQIPCPGTLGWPDQAGQLARIAALEDAAVAVDRAGSAALWAYRERHSEAISAAGVPHKLDIAVPVASLAALRGALDSAVSAAAPPGRPLRMIVFGHIGVGNLHVNVLGPDPADQAVDEVVLRLAAAHGGSISAEHGIGRAKVPLLPDNRSVQEIGAMSAIKTALDPAGLLNPGVLFT